MPRLRPFPRFSPFWHLHSEMRIFLFAQHYPVPYKSYYDTQFVDLLQQGHEITIWAGSGLDSVLNEKVRRFGLADRTRQYPTTLRTLPRFGGTLIARFLRHPRWSTRTAKKLSAERAPLKQRLMYIARALVLGPATPDLCLVHELGTGVMFPFLRTIYPNAATALYYHGGETPIVSQLQKNATSNALQSVDIVYSNTHFSRQHAIDRGCPPENIAILPVGFATEDFNPPARRTYRRSGTLELLSAGRMSDEKGFNYALEAVNALVKRGITNIRYSLTGEGYLKPRLEAYVAEHQLQPYVRFLGTLSTEEVLQAMLDADALLLPSLHLGNWAENQACAVQEAMLMKTLVVTTQTGGVPESIAEEMRRFSIPAGDADAIANAIMEILAMSDHDLTALGEAGRAFVLRGYDVRRLNEQLLERTLAAAQARTTRSMQRHEKITSAVA
jgi:colanic acid/amylovoran biosynthesis glycosyltransferase